MATFISNLLGTNPSQAQASGKLELPLSEEEPLAASPMGPLSEKCELRIEAMTCGACVEVRSCHGLDVRVTDVECSRTVEYRGHAEESGWHSFGQGCFTR